MKTTSRIGIFLRFIHTSIFLKILETRGLLAITIQSQMRSYMGLLSMHIFSEQTRRILLLRYFFLHISNGKTNIFD